MRQDQGKVNCPMAFFANNTFLMEKNNFGQFYFPLNYNAQIFECPSAWSEPVPKFLNDMLLLTLLGSAEKIDCGNIFSWTSADPLPFTQWAAPVKHNEFNSSKTSINKMSNHLQHGNWRESISVLCVTMTAHSERMWDQGQRFPNWGTVTF